MNLVRKLSAGIAGSSLALMLAVAPASGAHTNVTVTDVQRNGAGGLVAAAAQATDLVNVNDSTVDIAIVELNNSLNNLRALNNVLNNSPILSNNDIIDDVTVQDVSVLSNNDIDLLNNSLNNNNIALDDVVGVAVLSGGDFIVFTQSQ